MNIQVVVDSEYGKPRLVLHSRVAFDTVAGLAIDLIKAPGALLLGEENGEDSSGRAKARFLTPSEMATRAFDISQAIFAEAEARGLVVEVPSWEEMELIAQEKRGRN